MVSKDNDTLEEEKNLNKNSDEKEWKKKKDDINNFFKEAEKEEIIPPQPIPETPTHSVVFDTIDEEAKKPEEEPEPIEKEPEEPEQEEPEQEEPEQEEPEQDSEPEEKDTDPEPEKQEPEKEPEKKSEEPPQPVIQPKPAPPRPQPRPYVPPITKKPGSNVQIKKFEDDPIYKKPMFYVIVIGVLIILFLIISFFMSGSPPSIIFVDSETKEPIFGKVLFNNQEVGDYSGEAFNDLPSEFCDAPGELALKVGEEIYKVDAYPGDCDTGKITYEITKKEIPISEMTLDFYAEDTNARLSGSLFFDDEFHSEITGTTTITVADCNVLTNIKLVTEGKEISWTNDKTKCGQVGTLEFTIPSLTV
ncbi:hypothetical protein ACFLZX_01210 [Nanoarchaeota archaeon]